MSKSIEKKIDILLEKAKSFSAKYYFIIDNGDDNLKEKLKDLEDNFKLLDLNICVLNIGYYSNEN